MSLLKKVHCCIWEMRIHSYHRMVRKKSSQIPEIFLDAVYFCGCCSFSTVFWGMKWSQICSLFGEVGKATVEPHLWFLERCLYLHLSWSLKSSLFQTVVWFNTLCWHFSAQGLDFSAHTGPVLLHNLYLRWLMSQAWKKHVQFGKQTLSFLHVLPHSFLISLSVLPSSFPPSLCFFLPCAWKYWRLLICYLSFFLMFLTFIDSFQGKVTRRL